MGWWWLVVALVLVGGLLVADRLLLMAEACGWIYYRRHRPSGLVRTGLMELGSFFEPGIEHHREAEQEEHVEESNSGDSEK